LSVLSANDIWVFGAPSGHLPALGAEHFNGKTWTQVPKTYANGSAASAKDVWASSGTTKELAGGYSAGNKARVYYYN
jgi:hypothetical protein